MTSTRSAEASIAPRNNLEALSRRQVFESWSIFVPLEMAETFVKKDGDWHASDEHRSISLTSIVLTDQQQRLAPASEILRQGKKAIGPGDRVVEMPPGLAGHAVTRKVAEPARGPRALSGVLAQEGRLLLVTITADDLEWARQIWLSIRPGLDPALAPPPFRPNRQMRRHAG